MFHKITSQDIINRNSLFNIVCSCRISNIKARRQKREKSLAPRHAPWHTFSMNISVAISGGVDSLFALLSLQEQGYDVTALHARFLSGSS
ncbi:MAG: hypothetical protein ACI4P0_04505, partial [Mailhella sp.]